MFKGILDSFNKGICSKYCSRKIIVDSISEIESETDDGATTVTLSSKVESLGVMSKSNPVFRGKDVQHERINRFPKIMNL